MTAPLYTTDILRLAASLPEPRPLDRVDGRAALRSPTCGATIETAVTRDDDGRIVAIDQRVSACAFGQASAALVQQSAIGRDRAEADAALADLTNWLDGRRDDPGSWPGLDQLAPARDRKSRHGAIILPFRALAAALGECR